MSIISYGDMQCPFCQQPMRVLDNGSILPGQTMIGICDHCPCEVRTIGERATKDDEKWHIKKMSIFVHHRNKEYCLLWDYQDNTFTVLDTGATGHIFRTLSQPTSINPTNAPDKLQLYLTFI